jgi:protein SCO1/2
MRHWLLGAAVLALLARGAQALPQKQLAPVGESAGANPILEKVDFAQFLGRQIPPDLRFRDEQGQEVTLGDYFQGRPVILSLTYYECPMLCSLVLNGLTSALRALPFDLGKEFVAVNVSFDARETPDLAKKKKEKYLAEYRRPGAERGWHFLTGDEESIRKLTEAVGFRYAWDERSQQFAHAAGIVLLTPQGQIARYFYGVEFSPRDLRFGLIEASQGRIGSPVDKLLLYCFHYDPLTGRYSAWVLNAIRAGGVLTLFALGLFFLFGSGRRWGRRPAALAPLPGSEVTSQS